MLTHLTIITILIYIANYIIKTIFSDHYIMRTNLKKYTIDYCDVMNYIVYIFFFFFLIVYSLLNIHRDLPVLFVSSLDYCCTFCAGVFPMPFFRCCCLDSNPDGGNANMVYERLNDVGHPDPPKYPKYLSHPHPLLCYLSPWIYNDRFLPGSHTYERGIYIDLQELCLIIQKRLDIVLR